MGKQAYGPYDSTQGGTSDIVADPAIPEVYVTSGATEPTWPTTLYDTVDDGSVIWTAIYARVNSGEVTGAINRALFQHNMSQYPDHYFQYGTVVFLTGKNAGRTSDIRDSIGATGGSIPYLFLLEIMPYPIAPGDTFEATVGCSKIRIACINFNNLDNHRAFPDMPTEDRALATPNISNQGYAPKQTK